MYECDIVEVSILDADVHCSASALKNLGEIQNINSPCSKKKRSFSMHELIIIEKLVKSLQNDRRALVELNKQKNNEIAMLREKLSQTLCSNNKLLDDEVEMDIDQLGHKNNLNLAINESDDIDNSPKLKKQMPNCEITFDEVAERYQNMNDNLPNTTNKFKKLSLLIEQEKENLLTYLESCK